MQHSIKWDHRFLDLAESIAKWSKDPSTKVGAVIVRPDLTVASMGFNGFPKGMPDDEALYQNREEKYPRIIHAELNSVLHCREVVKGYMMYSSLLPCDRCLVHASQAGITRFVAPVPPSALNERWGASFAMSRKIAAEMGLDLVEY